MLKDCLANFQKAVKSAKSKYFSNLIAKNHHSSKALFSVLNSVLNPPVNVISNPSVLFCEGFSRFFCDKITTEISAATTCLMFHLNCAVLQLYG